LCPTSELFVNVLLFPSEAFHCLNLRKKRKKKYLSFVELVLTLIYKVKGKNKRYVYFDEIVRITMIIYIFLLKYLKIVISSIIRSTKYNLAKKSILNY